MNLLIDHQHYIMIFIDNKWINKRLERGMFNINNNYKKKIREGKHSYQWIEWSLILV